MTKTFSFLFALGVAAACLIGCDHTHYTEEIRHIDSLLVVLDSTRNDHRRIDTTGFETAMENYSERMSAVQAAYAERGDTMGYDVAMMMARYRELKKPLERFKDTYEEVSTELDFSRSQLLDLKHDLEHNLLDSNIVERMLRSETEAVEHIEMRTEQLRLSMKTTREKTEIMEPKVDSLLNRLQTDTLEVETEIDSSPPS